LVDLGARSGDFGRGGRSRWPIRRPQAGRWRQERLATLIPGLGISASHLGFVAGFMIMTIAAPIAVVEAFVPDRADRPWLGRIGLTVVGLLYLLGAGFVFARGWPASPPWRCPPSRTRRPRSGAGSR
jgi:hypothetical protein